MTPEAVYLCPLTTRRYDPLRVRRQLLLLSEGKFNDWVRDQRGEDELKSLEAEERILPVVRRVFDLPDATDDPAGHTDGQCLEVLSAYLEYLQGKGGRGQLWRPKSPCSDCPPA